MNKQTLSYVACLTGLLCAVARAGAQEIVINAELPKFPAQLAVYKLEAATLPLGLMTDLLRGLAVDAPFAPMSGNDREQQLGVFEAGRLRARMDASDGSAQLFPTLSQLKPIPTTELNAAADIAKRVFARSEFIPPDATIIDIVPRGDLKQSRAGTPDVLASLDASSPGYLSYYMAQRFVGEYPVEGPGSRAMVAVGTGGTIHGMTRIWRAASNSVLAATMDPQLVRDSMIARIKRLTSDPKLVLTVPDARIVYYDDNASYLQPVLRFIVTMGPASQANPALFTGYVPLVDGVKALGSKADKSKLTQLQPVGTPLGALKVPSDPFVPAKPILAATSAPPRTVRVGRFLATFADADSAEEWEISSRDLVSALTGSALTFDKPQEEPLTNYLVLNTEVNVISGIANSISPNPKIGDVDLALFEAHGDPWKLYGYDTWDAPVQVGALPVPSPNRLTAADWILHSCSVIPSEVDMQAINKASAKRAQALTVTAQDTAPLPTWDTPWRRVLGSVRSVVGYRTRMFVDDGAPAAYARRLSANARISSWFNEVASLNRYARSVMGRASAVFVCGHADDTLSDQMTPVTGTVCLENWWMADCSGRSCPKTTEKDVVR